MKPLTLVLIALVLVGCSYGYIKRSVERVSPSGEKYTERSEVRTPQNPTQPASMTGGDGASTQPFSASTGAGQAISQALQSMDKLVWIGAGLMVLGVGLVIVKVMFFPIIPLEAGIGLVLLGLGMTFIPGIWESYKLWVVLTIGLVVIGGASMIVWRMNKKEAVEPTTKRSEP